MGPLYWVKEASVFGFENILNIQSRLILLVLPLHLCLAQRLM